MNLVPDTRTKTAARRMLRRAAGVESSGADAVLRHLRDVRSHQIPALIGYLLDQAVANQPEQEDEAEAS